MSTLEAPKLRFPKFTGSWEKKSLGDIATFTKGAGISKEDITPSGNQKAIRYGELYTTYGETITDVKSKTNLESSQLVLSKTNDVIIPASGETAIDIATASCVLDDGIALSGDINIVRSSNNGIFLAYYLNNAKKLDIARRAQGVSVIHLYKSGLQSLDLHLPSNEEQNTIASFLSLVDENIKAIEGKIALSKRYKVGVLQKLFPRKGQTNPELRFKNDVGLSFPDWQEVSVGEVTSLFSNRNRKPEDALVYSVTNTRGFVIQTEHFDKVVAGDDLSSYKVVRKNDFAYNPARVNVGSIARFNDELGIISSLYVCFRCSKGVTPEFMEYFLQLPSTKHYFGVFGEGGVRIYLWYPLFSLIRFKLPTLEEQKRITSFLHTIDEELSDQERKLEQAKQFKKALLQQMFV